MKRVLVLIAEGIALCILIGLYFTSESFSDDTNQAIKKEAVLHQPIQAEVLTPDLQVIHEVVEDVEEEEVLREEAEAEEIVTVEEEPRYVNICYYDSGSGHLTPSGGVYYYGNQKETYYNLDMSYVVYLAHQNGISGEYWVRDDGCKMLGDYIILACNRDVHPYGSIVETSLGLGISLDTGEFAYDNYYQIDIATNW